MRGGKKTDKRRERKQREKDGQGRADSLRLTWFWRLAGHVFLRTFFKERVLSGGADATPAASWAVPWGTR